MYNIQITIILKHRFYYRYKMELELKELAVTLYDIQAVKFGEFKTKVGLRTPVYFDLRMIISHPKVMVSICNVT